MLCSSISRLSLVRLIQIMVNRHAPAKQIAIRVRYIPLFCLPRVFGYTRFLTGRRRFSSSFENFVREKLGPILRPMHGTASCTTASDPALLNLALRRLANNSHSRLIHVIATTFGHYAYGQILSLGVRLRHCPAVQAVTRFLRLRSTGGTRKGEGICVHVHGHKFTPSVGRSSPVDFKLHQPTVLFIRHWL